MYEEDSEEETEDHLENDGSSNSSNNIKNVGLCLILVLVDNLENNATHAEAESTSTQMANNQQATTTNATEQQQVSFLSL